MSSRNRLAAAILFLIVCAAYLGCASPGLTQWDSAELVLAGMNLDVTHPPGYGLLSLFNRLALCPPVGGPTFRLGFTGAVLGGLSAALLFGVARTMGWRRSASMAAALWLAAAPFMWTQSTMVEKFSLNIVLTLLVLRKATRADLSLGATTFAFGLCVAHHQLSVLLIPIVGAAAWRHVRGRMGRPVLIAGFLLLIPVSTRLLYAPVRTAACAAEPVLGARFVNWGEPGRWPAFKQYALASEYRDRFTRNPIHGFKMLSDHMRVWWLEIGAAGLGLAAAGLIFLFSWRPYLAVGVAGSILLSVIFNLGLIVPPELLSVYHQDDLVLLALLVGAGVETVGSIGHRITRAAAAALLLVPLGRFVLRGPATVDASRNYLVHDLFIAVTARAPRDAVVIGVHGLDRFAIRDLQAEFGRREDLRTIQLGVASGSLSGILQKGEPGACFAMSALSSPFASPDRFAQSGAVYLARGSGCGSARSRNHTATPLWPMSFRSWWLPVNGTPVNMNFKGSLMQAISGAQSSP